MKCIVYTQDGLTRIVHPAMNARKIKIGKGAGPAYLVPDYRNLERFHRALADGVIEFAESETEFLERVKRKSVPADAQNVQLSDVGDLPQSRDFRQAWVQHGSRVEIDMTKAREVHRDRIREQRAPMLAALDIEYQRADEVGDTSLKKEIAAKKQALRDATADPSIDAAQTPDELSNLRLTDSK